MITVNELQEIGKFQRTHALKGELNAVLDIDPVYIMDGNPVIVELDGCFIPFYAESIRPKGSISYLISLDGVDDITQAEKFVNKKFYALKSCLKEYLDEETFLLGDLVGFTVEDVIMGKIGKIDSIDDSTVNTLFYISGEDSEEIIIPASEHLIEDIDIDKKLIRMQLPEGLVG